MTRRIDHINVRRFEPFDAGRFRRSSDAEMPRVRVISVRRFFVSSLFRRIGVHDQISSVLGLFGPRVNNDAAYTRVLTTLRPDASGEKQVTLAALKAACEAKPASVSAFDHFFRAVRTERAEKLIGAVLGLDPVGVSSVLNVISTRRDTKHFLLRHALVWLSREGEYGGVVTLYDFSHRYLKEMARMFELADQAVGRYVKALGLELRDPGALVLDVMRSLLTDDSRLDVTDDDILRAAGLKTLEKRKKQQSGGPISRDEMKAYVETFDGQQGPAVKPEAKSKPKPALVRSAERASELDDAVLYGWLADIVKPRGIPASALPRLAIHLKNGGATFSDKETFEKAVDGRLHSFLEQPATTKDAMEYVPILVGAVEGLTSAERLALESRLTDHVAESLSDPIPMRRMMRRVGERMKAEFDAMNHRGPITRTDEIIRRVDRTVGEHVKR